MKTIQLTKGKNTIVDDDWYDMLSLVKWCTSGSGYAYKKCYMSAKVYTEHMHRVIMDAPKGMQVDHINGGPLDNRRENLRLCTVQQNNQNRKPSTRSSSKYKGVHKNTWCKTWVAVIKVNYKKKHLGSFKCEKEAAKAYDEAAKKYFGEFARVNGI